MLETRKHQSLTARLSGVSVRCVVAAVGGAGADGGVVAAVVAAQAGAVDAVAPQGGGQTLEVVGTLEFRH